MDEKSKEITKETLVITVEGMDRPMESLLWVDDVILAAIESTNLHRKLNVPDHTSNKYHTEYGALKSNVTTISYGNETEKHQHSN